MSTNVTPVKSPEQGSFATRSPSEAPKARLAYAIDRKFLSPRLEILATNTGDVVMQQSRHVWERLNAEADFKHRFLACFMKPVVRTGILSDAVDIEAVPSVDEVLFSSLRDSPELTAALHRSALLCDERSFAAQYPNLVTGSPRHEYAIIMYKMKKTVLLLMFLTTLMVSMVAGLIVGLVTRNVQIGFACFSGLGLSMSLLLSFIYEMSKH